MYVCMYVCTYVQTVTIDNQEGSLTFRAAEHPYLCVFWGKISTSSSTLPPRALNKPPGQWTPPRTDGPPPDMSGHRTPQLQHSIDDLTPLINRGTWVLKQCQVDPDILTVSRWAQQATLTNYLPPSLEACRGTNQARSMS
jgi:hypothetical protein